MLKGHGTLKTLLGRSVGSKKRKADEEEDVFVPGVRL